jgi:hypothetical protein
MFEIAERDGLDPVHVGKRVHVMLAGELCEGLGRDRIGKRVFSFG